VRWSYPAIETAGRVTVTYPAIETAGRGVT
jgi:hypothetical protein